MPQTAMAQSIAARDGSWSTGTLAPGADALVTFDRPGTFLYHYTAHRGGHRLGAIDGGGSWQVRQPSAKAVCGDHGARRVSAR